MTFGRRTYERPARVYPGAAPAGLRRAVMARCDAPADPDPKTVARRNPHLLAMAKDKPCLLRVPEVCHGGTETTVACHSNSQRHGKAGARKADDQYSVWGCMLCHRWLDQGAASAEEKEAAFTLAHRRQVIAWQGIVQNMARTERERQIAHWALDALGLVEKSKDRVITFNEHGKLIGECHPMAKIPNGDIELVFELKEAGLSPRQIGEKLEMKKRYVQKILAGDRRGQAVARVVKVKT